MCSSFFSLNWNPNIMENPQTKSGKYQIKKLIQIPITCEECFKLSGNSSANNENYS
jgi:hypothetical protein